VFDRLLDIERTFGEHPSMARTHVRHRGGATLAVALTLVLGWTTLRAGQRADPAGQRSAASHTYIVAPGDTLWGIAARLSGPQADPRSMVDRLIAMNRVEDGVIQPGQRLVLP
jgi:Tfp pilus assembly protein FimV